MKNRAIRVAVVVEGAEDARAGDLDGLAYPVWVTPAPSLHLSPITKPLIWL